MKSCFFVELANVFKDFWNNSSFFIASYRYSVSGRKKQYWLGIFFLNTAYGRAKNTEKLSIQYHHVQSSYVNQQNTEIDKTPKKSFTRQSLVLWMNVKLFLVLFVISLNHDLSSFLHRLVLLIIILSSTIFWIFASTLEDMTKSLFCINDQKATSSKSKYTYE